MSKYLPNIISNKLYEKSKEKLSRIAIPKYRLILKPVIAKRINYIYIKDVPIMKIPKIIPNYSTQDKKIYSLIKSLILKNKLSILIINGKSVPKKIKNRKNISKEFSRDYDILNSVKSSSSEDVDTFNNSTLLNISRFYINKIISLNFRKKNKDINEIERLIYTILLNTEEGKELGNDNNENLLSSQLDSLKTINENSSEVFLSTLKKIEKKKLKKLNLKKQQEIKLIKNKRMMNYFYIRKIFY